MLVTIAQTLKIKQLTFNEVNNHTQHPQSQEVVKSACDPVLADIHSFSLIELIQGLMNKGCANYLMTGNQTYKCIKQLSYHFQPVLHSEIGALDVHSHYFFFAVGLEGTRVELNS